jgi:hypothetical protein
MKNILLISIVLISGISQANICDQSKVILIGGSDFYKNFLFSSENLKQPYTYFYQNVDEVLENHIDKKCSGREESSKSLEVEHNQLCKITCKKEAIKFHELLNTKFLKKQKIKTLTKECQSVCNKEL